ncbi:DinB family protein [Granulicella tundricola]|uniref:DinB-like domain-containing protein n=1 Tax=Granulicella tundricola (strain ATCC BAA-1859 / DSM 23138 / MP5ACTX9) TaxID=1198114 RepID=E8X2C3_GRATM|nr:DinB family protein [Granulicella tundricola]ADW68055.1 hypothetical protein AciX9_0988 [Granulicella tundricola MP5ACTX9]
MRKILVLAALAATTFGAHAQMGNMKMPAAAAVAGDPAKADDSMLTDFEGEFMAAAKAMPADKYSFTPASLNIPGAKFDGVRTFGEEVTHVAQANYSIYAGLMGAKPDVDVKAIGNLKSKDEIVAAATASFAYAHKAIATLTAANSNMTLRAGHADTKSSLGAYGVAHGFDHYGQMVEYLRMNGIVPPASAK